VTSLVGWLDSYFGLRIVTLGWSECDVWLDCWYNWNRRSIGVYSRKWLESLKEVVNKDTDKEAQVPASVFIIADCWLVVTRVHCGQTVHPGPIVTMRRFLSNYFNLLFCIHFNGRPLGRLICRLADTDGGREDVLHHERKIFREGKYSGDYPRRKSPRPRYQGFLLAF